MTLYSSVRSGLTLVCVVAALVGCESVPFMPTADRISGLITPYKVEIVQGNVVTQEQVDRIRTGMPRSQVRDILGSPLLTDVFHADRWDYVFTIRRQGTEPQRRNVVAIFDGERLKSLDTGGELPSELSFVASIDATKSDVKIPPLTMSEDQLKSLKAPVRAAPVEPAAAASAAARVYPPLEPL
jgi:outer membrane protein assembly factor BamE